MKKWRAIRVCMLLAALVFLGGVLARLGPHEVAEELSSVGPRALWLLLVYVVGTAIGAVPWYVLLDRSDRPSLRAAVTSRFAASGANTIVPLLGLGGEPVRLMWMRPHQRAAGAAAIILDRLTYALASGLFLAAGALTMLTVASMPRAFVITAIAGAALLLVIVVAIGWLVIRGRVAERMHRLVRRLRRRTKVDGTLFGESVDRALGSMLERRGDLVLAVALGLAARLALGTEIYAGFLILGIPLSPAEAIVFAGVPVLLAFVGAIVPSQIGIQEGSQALVAGALGIFPATAVAVVLLQRIRQLITAALAWLLIATNRPKLDR